MKRYKVPVIKVPAFNEENGYYTTPERSRVMKKVRSENTKAEILFRKKLWNLGIRYRKNFKKIIGTPDIAITKNKIAIFIDGEFWHGKDWSNQRKKLKSNKSFWIAKIERNIQRDNEYNKTLKEQGWTVIRFWEKEINKNVNECIEIVLDAIH